jgi:hypothetical protein
MTSESKLLANLRKLYTQMLACCWDLSKHSEQGEQHAEELNSAAEVVQQWIEEIENEQGSENDSDCGLS